MPSDLTSADIAADFAAMYAGIPDAQVVVSINGNAYNGLRARMHRLPELADVGLRDNFSLSVFIEIGDLAEADIPIPLRTKATIDGTTYLIVNTKDDSTGTILRVDLGKDQ